MRSPAAAILAAVALTASTASAATLFDFGAGVTSPEQVIDYSPAPAAEVKAPSSLPLGVEEQASVTMTPSVPKAGDRVTIRVDSYSDDLNKAAIIWTQDGVTVAEGFGLVEYSFTAPASGRSTVITFRAAKVKGGVLSRTFTVAPADVDILYEAETYTPPFYRGKARFTNSSAIRLVAVPDFVSAGAQVSPESLVYTWREEGRVVQAASGYGRNIYRTTGDLVTSGINVEVEVSDPNSDLKATARAGTSYVEPSLVLYRKDPLLGIVYEHAWSGKTTPLEGTEVTLAATPYSMDATGPNDGRLSYEWFVNDVPSGQVGSSAVFRKQGGGIAAVSVALKHLGNFAQFAEAEGEINLGDASSLPQAGAAL